MNSGKFMSTDLIFPCMSCFYLSLYSIVLCLIDEVPNLTTVFTYPDVIAMV